MQSKTNLIRLLPYYLMTTRMFHKKQKDFEAQLGSEVVHSPGAGHFTIDGFDPASNWSEIFENIPA